ncbi:MAG: hypothetical protein KF861_23555, partial [Planctomycetaceae bacterium]|nr:hypothetical protein [Planctomycetaceae bacterium]
MWERSSQFVRYRNLFRHVETPWPLLARKFGLAQAGPLRLKLRNGVGVHVPCNFNEFKCLVLDDCYFKGFRPQAFQGI